MQITLLTKKKEAQNAYSLIFSNDSNMQWIAGEYMLMTLPHENPDDRGLERPFTISSSPKEGIVMLTTRYFDNESSSFKKALFNLREGSKIEVLKPSNSDTFFNSKDPSRNYIFLTAGIGITPVRSVVKDYSLNKLDLKGTLLYANKNDDYIFGEELEQISNDMPNFTLQKYHGKRINRGVLEGLLKEYDSPIFNISGTKDFTNQMKEILLNQLKIDPTNVRTSSFGDGY
jgi:ferredoxin-NADP reductase